MKTKRAFLGQSWEWGWGNEGHVCKEFNATMQYNLCKDHFPLYSAKYLAYTMRAFTLDVAENTFNSSRNTEKAYDKKRPTHKK